MRKYGRIVVIILSLLVVFSPFVSAGETLRIATCDDYPPLGDVNEQGEFVGFDMDIARALCQAMGRSCELIAVEWEGILDGLVAGKYDAIIASMGATPEREKLVSFTEYYSRSSASFVGRIDAGLTISPTQTTSACLP